MTEPKYDPSTDRLTAGATVASRRDPSRVIGQVDSSSRADGQWWALVSWPAEDMPHARTDERGRRCQGFDVASLVVTA